MARKYNKVVGRGETRATSEYLELPNYTSRILVSQQVRQIFKTTKDGPTNAGENIPMQDLSLSEDLQEIKDATQTRIKLYQVQFLIRLIIKIKQHGHI